MNEKSIIKSHLKMQINKNKMHNYIIPLFESLSSEVFHFTYISSLLKMLRSGKMKLTPNIGTHSDDKLNSNKFYSMSFQNSKFGNIGYSMAMSSSEKVCVNFDGDKLNHLFTGKPVNYWGDFGNVERGHRDFMHNFTRYNELEERLLSNKPYIDDVYKYIHEIHILSVKPEERAIKMICEILQLCNDNNIPIYVYNDPKSFNHQIKEKSIEIDCTNQEKENIDYHDSPLTYIAALLIIYDESLKPTICEHVKNSKSIAEKINHSKKAYNLNIDYTYYCDDIDKDISNMEYNYLRYYSQFTDSEFKTLVANAIHNNKTSDNDFNVFIINLLIKQMMKHKIRTLYKFIEFVYKKVGIIK